MTADPFRPGDPAEYWQMEGESDGYRAIAVAVLAIAFGTAAFTLAGRACFASRRFPLQSAIAGGN